MKRLGYSGKRRKQTEVRAKEAKKYKNENSNEEVYNGSIRFFHIQVVDRKTIQDKEPEKGTDKPSGSAKLIDGHEANFVNDWFRI